MSPEMNRLAASEAAIHDRARILAAESVDGPLAPAEGEWLTDHLSACPDCAAVAEEYAAIHVELRSLALPQPPRDLWARTAGALDALDSKAAGRAGVYHGPARSANRPLVATAVAVGCVVVVAAASLLAQTPVVAPATAPARSGAVALATPSAVQSSGSQDAPLAVVNGTSYWIAGGAGVYEIKGGTAECAASDGSCTVASGVKTLGSITSDQSVSAAIAPDASRAAVWTPDKVVILPLATTPKTVSIDLLTPQPTAAAAPTAPPATAPPVPSASATAPAVPSASASAAASTTPVPSVPSGSIQTPTPEPTATPAPPTAAPATPSPAPSTAAATGPIAILSGYEIVGRDPEFSTDGRLVAFAARPADHSAGPDVFVWRSGQVQATRITFRHSALFAGWFGGRILISEISAPGVAGGAVASALPGDASARSTSYIFDPSTDTAFRIGRPMLLPAVDPTGTYLVYWAGTVELDPATGLWGPAGGDLFFDAWSDLSLTPVSLAPAANPSPSPSPSPSPVPSPSPSGSPSPSSSPSPSFSPKASPLSSPSPAVEASSVVSPEPTLIPAVSDSPSEPSPTKVPVQPALPQVVPVAPALGMVVDWSVSWDASGGHVAIWVADPGSTRIGRLSLLTVDRANGRVVTNEPLLAADKVSAGIALDSGHLVYTSAIDGKTYMQDIPAVPPSTVATPAPATPGPLTGGSPAAASPSAPATDRPGN